MRIWVDVSDLVKWPGQVSGIQRVSINFAKALIERGLPVGFFCWNGHGFVEAPEAEVAKALSISAGDRGGAKATTPVRSSATTEARDSHAGPKPMGVKGKVIFALKQVYRKSPSWMQGLIFAAWQFQMSIRARVLRLVRGKGAALFAKDEWILVVGNNWSVPYLPFLLEVKREAGCRYAQVIYDMIPVLFPQYFRAGIGENYRDKMREVIANSELLLAISEHTKRDFARFAEESGLKLPRTEVIRLGDEISPVSIGGGQAPMGDAKASDGEPFVELVGKPFVLSVGTIEVRKNHIALVNAWKALLAKGEKLPMLIFVGRKGWLVEEVFELINSDPKLAVHVRHLDNVNDQGLAWLYKNCLFTAYPSLYEGWGLPVAESLKNGKACVASRISSIPEISDLIDFIDPRDQADIERVILNLVKNDSTREAKEKLIRETYKPTPWTETVRPFIEAITQAK